MRRTLCRVVVVGLLVVGFAPVAQGQAGSEQIRIKNFGRVNRFIYRGAQPARRDYATLAALGIKAVIDLQRVGQEEEQALVEAAGMKFYRIPMSDSSRPRPEQIEEFLRLVSDASNQPVFVHCHGGRHRTGALIAIYRLVFDGWGPDRAYQEMKQYEFKKGFGHGPLKDCVYDYYAQLGVSAGATSAVNR